MCIADVWVVCAWLLRRSGVHVYQLIPGPPAGQTCGAMAEAPITRLLPAEMLERVFHLLPPRDLKAVVLVCRWWREVGEAAGLWNWVILTVNHDNLPVMAEMLAARRLQGVRKMEVYTHMMPKELLGAMARHPGLREVDVRVGQFCLVEPVLVVPLVTGLEVLDLAWCHITPSQASTICQNLAMEKRLRSLNLSWNHLGSVAPQLVARLALVEQVDLTQANLTPPQLTALFAALDGGPSKMERLKISFNNVSSINADLLARAANKLVAVEMKKCSISEHQASCILTQSLQSTSLKSLKLWEWDWLIDSQLKARAREVLETLELSDMADE